MAYKKVFKEFGFIPHPPQVQTLFCYCQECLNYWKLKDVEHRINRNPDLTRKKPEKKLKAG